MNECPDCQNSGRKVNKITLEKLLHPKSRPRIGDGPYFVCTTPDCETVYFGPGGGGAFGKKDLTVRFGLKETDSPRPVCYCFDHSVEAIHDEIARTGKSTVLERIKADMTGPGCRCEQTNPLGACCLNTVRSVVADAFRSAGRAREAEPAATCDVGDCCGDSGARVDASDTGNRAGALAAGGSVVAAILSSACCWLPLLLIAFGASAAGVAGFFEVYRPYFIAVAVTMLGIGFYLVYFRRDACAPGTACAAPDRRMRRFRQATLWTATVLVGSFVFFPNYVGNVFGSSGAAIADEVGLATLRFHIEGMTCEGCATNLRIALEKVPGVKLADVDYAKSRAVIRYEPDQAAPTDRVIDAVKAAGYRARVGEGKP